MAQDCTPESFHTDEFAVTIGGAVAFLVFGFIYFVEALYG